MVSFGVVRRLAPMHNSLDLISEPLWMWSRKFKTEAMVILARNPLATIAATARGWKQFKTEDLLTLGAQAHCKCILCGRIFISPLGG